MDKLRNPSPRLTAVLAAAMLAIGVAVGAAIGPAPSPSFALGRLLPLLPSLLGAGERANAPAAQSPAGATATAGTEDESGRALRHRRRHKRAAAEASSAETPAATETTAPAASTPTNAAKPKTSPLPAVTKVWLIELGNSSFSELAAHPSAAPYTVASALPAGTLLGGWSALEAGAFASEAALLAGAPPQLVDTIVQPPCPASTSAEDASPAGEAAPGASGATATACQPDTPGALGAADEFLKATLPAITATSAYRENGLVVITFASITAATEGGLPAGTATATLTSQPPAGALLISPFVAAGARSSTAFDPTSPRQSLEQLLRR